MATKTSRNKPAATDVGENSPVAETVASPNPEERSSSELKQGLIFRAGIAALLIAGLLGALAWLDEAGRPPPPAATAPAQALPQVPALEEPLPEETAAATETTTAEAKEVTADSAAETTAATVTADPSGVAAVATGTPDKAVAPTQANNATRQAGASAGLPQAPSASKALAAPAAGQPQAAVAASTHAAARLPLPRDEAPAPAVEETSAAPTQPEPVLTRKGLAVHGSEAATASSDNSAQPANAASAALLNQRPLTRRAPQAAAPARTGHYLLQMGVFSTPERAEELRAKLELNGIPARIETRVQVGPFKNRQEAQEMSRRLQSLGMGAGMLVDLQKK